MEKIISESIEINGKILSFEVGRFASQANAAVLARLGDTIVLATVVSSLPREDLDFLPLDVEYQEKLYAGGKIKGSRWVKREGRPSDEAVLSGRLVDRSIRPLFPSDYKNEIQMVITVLSVDGENDPAIVSACATSAVLSISDIPWKGPIGTVRVGKKNGDFFINPSSQELTFSDLDLVVSATSESIVMIEGGAKEVTEEEMVKAVRYSQNYIQKIIDCVNALTKKVGRKKQTYEVKKFDERIKKEIEKEALEVVKDLLKQTLQNLDFDPLKELVGALVEKYPDEKKALIKEVVDQLFWKKARERIFEKKKRIDGRSLDEVRPISIEVGILPRTHGSAIFNRGDTQALTITTLGSPSLEQWIESMEGEETKRYIHHYYMPPYSVGEVGRFAWPSRREVGHGALAERALEPMIPLEERFPYTIRVVSEITSSNGSTSMASVCGSSLSLMDAGVPIKKPVAGVAMGLILKAQSAKRKVQSDEFVVLTDIAGIEDHLGDMDFKVAGTAEGITALQMDVKTLKLNVEILTAALQQAKEARLSILEEMKKVLPAPRSQISQYAPKVAVLQITPDKIGEVIGPGGRMIRKIINETGVAMDVADDGMVTISGMDKQAVSRAIAWVEGLTREVNPGEVFEGEVKRIQPFGIFVEILPGKEGLVHISEMSPRYLASPHDLVKVGQKVKIRVKEIDEQGRLNLSMLFGKDAQKGARQPSGPRRSRPGYPPTRPDFKKFGTFPRLRRGY